MQKAMMPRHNGHMIRPGSPAVLLLLSGRSLGPRGSPSGSGQATDHAFRCAKFVLKIFKTDEDRQT